MPTTYAWTPDGVLKGFALGWAVIACLIGLTQYRRAQQWKRAEWVAQEMKALFGDRLVQAALLMIDWGSRKIPLYPDQTDPEKRHVLLTNEQVARALMHHSERSERFSDLEADIRAAFNRALDGLERFSAYVDTGLVKLGDLQPYLKYWATSLFQSRATVPGGEDRIARLRVYMKAYGFDGAHSLLEHIAAAEQRASATRSGLSPQPSLASSRT